MKRFVTILLLALAAVLTTCTPCEAKRSEVVIASVFSYPPCVFTNPKQNARLAFECDSLISEAVNFEGDSLSFKAKTETLMSSFYVFKKRINGRLFVECYHTAIVDLWSDPVDFYRVMYDPYYEYVGWTSYSFTFVKQKIINTYHQYE